MSSAERFFALKISLVMAIRMLGLFMLFPVMSVYAGDYESATPFLIGMAIGIYGLTQALFQIPFGYLSDRFGRKPILLIGLLVFLLGSILAANTSNIIIVVIGRAFQGGGAISAVLMAFLADSVSEENRAKANAFVGFQIGVAFMLSLLIGPIISSRVGLSGLFWVIALLSLIAMLIVLSLKHTKSITYYKLSLKAFKENFTKELLALDFSIFSLHLILAAGFIVMPLLIMENQIVSMLDNWQLYLPAVLLSFLGMIPFLIPWFLSDVEDDISALIKPFKNTSHRTRLAKNIPWYGGATFLLLTWILLTVEIEGSNILAHEFYGAPLIGLLAIGLTLYSWGNSVTSRNGNILLVTCLLISIILTKSINSSFLLSNLENTLFTFPSTAIVG